MIRALRSLGAVGQVWETSAVNQPQMPPMEKSQSAPSTLESTRRSMPTPPPSEPKCSSRAGKRSEVPKTEGGLEGSNEKPALTPRRSRRAKVVSEGTSTIKEHRRRLPPTPESLPRRPAGPEKRKSGRAKVKPVVEIAVPPPTIHAVGGSDAAGGAVDVRNAAGSPPRRSARVKRKKGVVISITERAGKAGVTAGESEVKRKRGAKHSGVDQSAEAKPKRRQKGLSAGDTQRAKGGIGIAVDKLGGDPSGIVVGKTENGVVEPIGKIWLIQERLRHDPWRMLVATALLNKTTGRAANPIREEIFRRWPSAAALAEASIPDLAELLYPLGLFNQRAASLIRFSGQYIQLGWPLVPSTSVTDKVKDKDEDLPPLPSPLDVTVFHGSGRYASDSFRIYSPLLGGGGGPASEEKWIGKRDRAVGRWRDKYKSTRPNQKGEEAIQPRERGEDGGGEVEMPSVEEFGGEMSDEDGEDGRDEWRKVRPTDKELRRYLIWRWGIEGITYDIDRGPLIKRKRDRRRLADLLDNLSAK